MAEPTFAFMLQHFFLKQLMNQKDASPHTIASYRDTFLAPGSLDSIQKVLSIPIKRTARREVGFLSVEEMQAIIDAPDLATWSGLRDHTMFTTLYNTGARVAEITKMKIMDLSLGTPSVRIHGKGRKDRVMPLWQSTERILEKLEPPRIKKNILFRPGDALLRFLESL